MVREQVVKLFVLVFQNSKRMSRFFFAICPTKSITETIVKCQQQANLSGRIIKKSNLHLTVLFLGKLNVNQLDKVLRKSEQITCPEFEIELNHIGYFKNSKIAWLGLESIPDQLLDLHKQLLSAANHCQLSLCTQRYKPHVTLVRKSLPVEKKLSVPIKWCVKDFVLLESIDTAKGVHYQPVQYFSCDD